MHSFSRQGRYQVGRHASRAARGSGNSSDQIPKCRGNLYACFVTNHRLFHALFRPMPRGIRAGCVDHMFHSYAARGMRRSKSMASFGRCHVALAAGR